MPEPQEPQEQQEAMEPQELQELQEVMEVDEVITYTHPISGNRLGFQASIKHLGCQGQCDRQGFPISYRSHHPVALLRGGNGVRPDDEDWFYRVVDQFNGDMIGRYDRASSYDDEYNYVSRICGIVLMSFEQWRECTTRIEGSPNFNRRTSRPFTLADVQTFETFIQALERRDR